MDILYYDDIKNADIKNISGTVVFLAGPTVRGNQPHLTSWRFEAIEHFRRENYKGTLIVPEFHNKMESDKNKDWIPLWENEGLKRADCILFWIPRTRELIGLTTNFEIGYWLAKDFEKIVYGAPAEAYRMAYIDIMIAQILRERKEKFGKHDDFVKMGNLQLVVVAAIERVYDRERKNSKTYTKFNV